MNKQQAARQVQEAVLAVNFDSNSASAIARKLFPGVEDGGLKRKIKELLVTLVQQQLNISDEAVLNFRTQRTAIEERFAPHTEIPNQALVAANAHLDIRKSALNVARTNLYTAIMSGDQSGTREPQAAYRSAEASIAHAEEEVTLARQQIRTAEVRRASEEEELSRQLINFDERNAVTAAFIEWRDKLQVELTPNGPVQPVPQVRRGSSW